jgi:hypothetical protein
MIEEDSYWAYISMAVILPITSRLPWMILSPDVNPTAKVAVPSKSPVKPRSDSIL